VEEQRTANVNLTADVGQYEQEIGKASQSTNQLAVSIDSVTTKLSNINKTAGRSLVGLGVGAAAGLTGAAYSAGRFEKSLSTLNASASLTGKSMDQLSGNVKQLAKDFPISLNDASQLVTMLSQMGVTTTQQINNMSQALVKVSGATGTDLMAVSTGLVELGRTMGTLNTNNMAKYSNSLVNVSTGAGVAAQSVLEFSNAIGPVARIAGMSEEQVLGVSGAFAKAGADGFAGATAFNRMVYGLTRSLQFGGPELKTYSDLLSTTTESLRGMDTADAMVAIFEELNKQGPLAIKTLDSLGLDGLRTIRSIQAVISSGSLQESITNSVSGSPDSLETGQKAAFSGLNDEMQRFGSNVSTFGINIGENITAPLKVAFSAANALMSTMAAIADTPLGAAATGATAAVGAVAGGVGSTMLGFGLLSKVALAGMAINGPLRMLVGGTQLGMGIDTAASRRAAVINQQVATGEVSRWRPSSMAAESGTRAGGYFPPIIPGQPGRFSQAAALPVRGTNWFVDSQAKWYGGSENLASTPTASLRSMMGISAQRVMQPLRGLGTEPVLKSATEVVAANNILGKRYIDHTKVLGFNREAISAATKETMGFGQAVKQLGGSTALYAANVTRNAAATVTRGAGSLAMAAAGGPAGMAIMGGIGAASLYSWYKDLDQQRSDEWGTIGINKYSAAAGLPGTASATFSVAPTEATLPPVKSRKDAAVISPTEATLAGSGTYQYVDPVIDSLSKESAKAYITSMGYLQPEQMQLVGQDLTHKFGADVANDILKTSTVEFPKANAKYTAPWASDLTSGMPAGQDTIGVAQYLGPASGIASDIWPITSTNRPGGTENPITKEYWTNFFGKLTPEQKMPYEAMVTGIGAEKTQVEAAYGTEAADATAIVRMYQGLSGIDSTDTAARNTTEQLLAEKFSIEGGFNYPGFDASGPVSDTDVAAAVAGAKLGGGEITNEQRLNELGYSLVGAEGYEKINLDTQKDIREFLATIQQTQKSYSAYEQTTLGKMFSSQKDLMKMNQEDSSAQIEMAQKVLDAAQKKVGSGDAWGELQTSYGAAPPGAIQDTYGLAMQLEDRQFSQGLWATGMSSWNANRIQLQRTEGQIGDMQALPKEDRSVTYREDLMALEDSRFQQMQSYRQSYESVILSSQSFHVSMARSEEEYQISRARTIEDYNQQVGWSYDDFYRNQERAQYDFQLGQERAQEDFTRSMNRMVEDQMAVVYNPYERITVEPTLDAGNLMLNIEEQNAALEQQQKNLKKLKKAGVDQSTIDFLGLADPKNAQQLARILADIRTDPKVAKELNKLAEDREDATGDLVASRWSRQYRRAVDDFKRMSERAREDFKRNQARTWEDFQRQIDRNQTLFTKSLARMAEDHKRQMEHMTEDFNRSLKVLTGSYENLEKRALGILENAGVKIMKVGSKQMDDYAAMITRKYNLVMRMLDKVLGVDLSGAGGSGGSGTSLGVGPATTSSYRGVPVTTTNSGSSTTAPQMSPKTRMDQSKLEKRNIDDNLKRRNKFLAVAYRQLGEPYNHVGDAGPDAFDCSGLVTFSANKVGISLAHSADAQMNSTKSIPSNKAIPGDLVGFDWDKNGRYDHIGIYVGNGSMIHANKPGGTVHVAGVGEQGGTPVFRRIPGLADGGIYSGPKLVGEGAGPEAVIPLNNRGHDYMFSMYKAISREIVKEIHTKQLGNPVMRYAGNGQYINASTTITGPITVKADDPNMMIKKIEAKKRRDALLRPSTAKSS